jgi:hypothetical protein
LGAGLPDMDDYDLFANKYFSVVIFIYDMVVRRATITPFIKMTRFFL